MIPKLHKQGNQPKRVTSYTKKIFLGIITCIEEGPVRGDFVTATAPKAKIVVATD